MFGHFELPTFKLNAMVEMSDHGGLKSEMFEHQDYVFSGHFHHRQIKGNVIYTGNAFPHNFSDSWDDERGWMFLEWDKEPNSLHGLMLLNTEMSRCLLYLKIQVKFYCQKQMQEFH